MGEPRQKTCEEIRSEFLWHIWVMVDYWSKVDDGTFDTRGRLAGLAHSILTAIDGYSCGLTGGFELVPTCHEDDPEFLAKDGRDWWPVNAEAINLAEGCPGHGEGSAVLLNDVFHSYDPRGS